MTGPKKSILPKALVYDQRIPDAAFRVLAALGIHTDTETGKCFTSLRTIANGLGKSRQAVHRQTRILADLGVIEIKPRKRGNGSNSSCEYRVLSRQFNDTPRQPDVDTPSTPEVDASNGPIERPIERKVIPLHADQGKPFSFEEMFDRWYAAYPLRKSRGAAKKAFKGALKKMDFQTLVAGARRYSALVDEKQTEPRYIKHPATWLNAECWDDEEEGGDKPLTEYERAVQQYIDAGESGSRPRPQDYPGLA